MHPVTLVVVHLSDRRVDRNLVKVGSTETRDLRIDVRVDAAREQRIVGEIDARNHVSRTERDLLGLGKEVVGVAVQHQLADGLYGYQLLGNDLRGVEDVEGETLGIFFSEDMETEVVFRKDPRLDRFPQIAAVKVRVRAG